MTEVLGAISRVPDTELSVETVCVPLRVAEIELDDELVSAGCVDDGRVCAAEVDVVALARSVLRQLICIMGANSVIVATSAEVSGMVITPVLGSLFRSGQLSVETVPVEMTCKHVCAPLFPHV